MLSQKPLLISTENAATALGCRKTKLFRLISERQIETVILGGRRMVVAASLDTLVDRLREQSQSTEAA